MANISTLPTYETKSFALWVAHTAETYFENPENLKRFEAWKKERELRCQPTEA